MHSVGEKIMYGGAGLMEIVDVREESFGDIPRKYYVLRDLRSSSDSQTFVPVDNDKLTSAMHPLLTKEVASDLISRAAAIPLLECSSDNRIRAEKFKSPRTLYSWGGMEAIRKDAAEKAALQVQVPLPVLK